MLDSTFVTIKSVKWSRWCSRFRAFTTFDVTHRVHNNVWRARKMIHLIHIKEGEKERNIRCLFTRTHLFENNFVNAVVCLFAGQLSWDCLCCLPSHLLLHINLNGYHRFPNNLFTHLDHEEANMS